MNIKAVIFDLDGTVLDTEKLLVKYWCMAANEAGFPMQREHALQLRSLAAKYAAPLMKTWFGESCDYQTLRKRRMKLMSDHLEKYGLEVKQGIPELLEYLGKKGLKRAVATATDLTRASDYLKQVGLFDSFDRIISAHMVENGKPKPDVYIYAVEQLGLTPTECIAVEDSPNGVLSASAAGCKTVMIPDLSEPDAQLETLLYAKCAKPDGLIELLEREEIADEYIYR